MRFSELEAKVIDDLGNQIALQKGGMNIWPDHLIDYLVRTRLGLRIALEELEPAQVDMIHMMALEVPSAMLLKQAEAMAKKE